MERASIVDGLDKLFEEGPPSKGPPEGPPTASASRAATFASGAALGGGAVVALGGALLVALGWRSSLRRDGGGRTLEGGRRRMSDVTIYPARAPGRPIQEGGVRGGAAPSVELELGSAGSNFSKFSK